MASASEGRDLDPLVPRPGWVLTAVVLGFVAAGRILARPLLGEEGSVTTQGIGQAAITFATGMWYYVRYAYTVKSTAVRGPFSLLFTVLIALSGLLCFVVVTNYRWWSFLLSMTLFLGTVKDLEIIHFTRKDMPTRTAENREAVLAGELRLLHHWYSIIRDVSMGFWWSTYGLAITLAGTEPDTAILLFGLPYVLLVLAWSFLKHYTLLSELRLFRKSD